MNLIEINEHTKNMEVGERLRLTGIPDNIYHATNGIGSTNLKRFIESPAGFRFGDGFEQKDCFDLGSAVHTLVLEPHLFDDAYVMMPETIPRKSGKKWDMFKEMNQGMTILKPSDMSAAQSMADSVMTTHAQYFTAGQAEVSYWYKAPVEESYDGGGYVLIKARVDYEIDDLAIDLKTTADAHPKKFESKAIDFGYHIQNQLYILATGLSDFVFVVVNNKKPYQVVGPMMFTDNAKELGLLKAQQGLIDFRDCMITNDWPNYLGVNDGEIIEMDLKNWHYRELEELQSKYY